MSQTYNGIKIITSDVEIKSHLCISFNLSLSYILYDREIAVAWKKHNKKL